MVYFISWADFIFWTLVLTAAYYFVVGIVFFRADMADLISGRKQILENSVADRSALPIHNTDEDDARLFSAVHDLLEDLKSLWNRLKDARPARAELLHALRVIIIKYPQLKGTAFEVAINNQVLLEADHFCSILLEDDDFKNIWMG